MVFSETDQDLRRYLARGDLVMDNCRGHAGADDAVCVDAGGPVGPMYRAVAAETGHCVHLQEMIHLDS